MRDQLGDPEEIVRHGYDRISEGLPPFLAHRDRTLTGSVLPGRLGRS
jgi:hypothetical protein